MTQVQLQGWQEMDLGLEIVDELTVDLQYDVLLILPLPDQIHPESADEPMGIAMRQSQK